MPLMVNQGLADNFLEEQLLTSHLEDACKQASYPLKLFMDEGYDHSYFFIASYIGEHIAFHADKLLK